MDYIPALADLANINPITLTILISMARLFKIPIFRMFDGHKLNSKITLTSLKVAAQKLYPEIRR
jgi:hypothetical protein